MKNFFLITTTMFVNLIYSQQSLDIRGNNIFITNINKTDSNTKGSQYLNEIFQAGRIDGHTNIYKLRHNAFSNYFEYEKSNTEIIKLDKVYKNISFLNNLNFILIDYIDLEGVEYQDIYVEVVLNSKENLVKKHRIKYNAAIESVSSYEKGRPAEYSVLSPTYIFKNGQEYLELPTKQKDLLKIFPEKASDIKKFMKENKIKLNNENNIISLVEFLNK